VLDRRTSADDPKRRAVDLVTSSGRSIGSVAKTGAPPSSDPGTGNFHNFYKNIGGTFFPLIRIPALIPHQCPVRVPASVWRCPR
jgi:hypothetical protein